MFVICVWVEPLVFLGCARALGELTIQMVVGPAGSPVADPVGAGAATLLKPLQGDHLPSKSRCRAANVRAVSTGHLRVGELALGRLRTKRRDG